MRIHILQLELNDGDVSYNINLVDRVLKTIDFKEKDVVVLPELWTTGYRLDKAKDLSTNALHPAIDLIQNYAKRYNVIFIAGSVLNNENNDIYNTAFVVNYDGEIIYKYSKIHLVPMLNEPTYLTEGTKQSEPFIINSQKAGLIICYDLRFPELTRNLALNDAKIIFVVAEWPKSRTLHWTTLLKARAIENQCYIVACNIVGTNSDGTTFAGNSMIVNPNGEVLKKANDLHETVLTETLNVDSIEDIRTNIPIFKSRRPELY